MAMTPEEYEVERWENNQWQDELLHISQLQKEILTDSFKGNLPSRYRENADIAVPAYRALAKARELLTADQADASLVMSVISIEQVIKKVFLEPLVQGLLHEEAWLIAPALVSSILGRRSWQEFNKVLFSIFREHAGIDLMRHRRQQSKTTVWEEAIELQRQRNKLIHEGCLGVSNSIAGQGVAVAEEFLEIIFPTLLLAIDSSLHVHTDYKLCPDADCGEGHLHN